MSDSKGGWDGAFAPWIAAAFGLAAIGLFAFVYPYSKGYQAADERHEAEYAARDASQQHYQECVAKSSVEEALECYQRADTASRDEQRAEKDLNAQREMADWAEGMLWATLFVGFLTISITGLGVYWVRETLVETRKAVKAADDAVSVTREIGEAQVRAYLSVTGGSFSVRLGSAHYHIKIKNVGQSPARNVAVRCTLDLAGRPGPNKYYVAWKASIPVISSSGEETAWFFYNIPPKPDFWGSPPPHYPEIPEDRANLLRDETFKHTEVSIGIGWDDVFGRRQNQTFGLQEIGSEKIRSDDGTTLIRREGELSGGKTRHYQDNVRIPDKK
jgi:hypothetical protein